MKRIAEVAVVIAAAVVAGVLGRNLLDALFTQLSLGTGAVCSFDAHECASSEA